jgi:cellulase/cellobiase CelA1
VTSPVNFTAKLPGTTAQLYQYSAADPSKIITLPSRQVVPAPVCSTCPPLATMTGSYAANSITTVVIGSGGPSPSPSATASTPTSPSPSAGASCTATYQITNQWSGGFQGDVTVRATGRAPVHGWTLNWTFTNGQKVTQYWNATMTQAGTVVTANNVAWNATIAPGGSTSFGFLGSWNGSNPIPATMSCSAI